MNTDDITNYFLDGACNLDCGSHKFIEYETRTNSKGEKNVTLEGNFYTFRSDKLNCKSLSNKDKLLAFDKLIDGINKQIEVEVEAAIKEIKRKKRLKIEKKYPYLKILKDALFELEIKIAMQDSSEASQVSSSKEV